MRCRKSLALGDKVLLAASIVRDSLPTTSASIQNPSPPPSARSAKTHASSPVPMPLPIPRRRSEARATCPYPFPTEVSTASRKALKRPRRGTPPADSIRAVRRSAMASHREDACVFAERADGGGDGFWIEALVVGKLSRTMDAAEQNLSPSASDCGNAS